MEKDEFKDVAMRVRKGERKGLTLKQRQAKLDRAVRGVAVYNNVGLVAIYPPPYIVYVHG